MLLSLASLSSLGGPFLHFWKGPIPRLHSKLFAFSCSFLCFFFSTSPIRGMFSPAGPLLRGGVPSQSKTKINKNSFLRVCLWPSHERVITPPPTVNIQNDGGVQIGRLKHSPPAFRDSLQSELHVGSPAWSTNQNLKRTRPTSNTLSTGPTSPAPALVPKLVD